MHAYASRDIGSDLQRVGLLYSFLARSGTNQRTGIHAGAALYDCSRPGEATDDISYDVI